jgi:hypothetical protein
MPPPEDAPKRDYRDLVSSIRSIVKAWKAKSLVAFFSDMKVHYPTQDECDALVELEEEGKRTLPPKNHECANVNADGSLSFYFKFSMRLTRGRGRSVFILPVRVKRKGSASKKPKTYHMEDPSVEWRDIRLSCEKFLDAIVDSVSLHAPAGKEGYDILWQWYRQNGRFFRFMNIPTELRLEIYRFMIGTQIYPELRSVPKKEVKMVLGNGFIPKAPLLALKNTHGLDDEVPPPNTALLQLNKHISAECYDEAWKEAWTERRYCFAELQKMSDVVRYITLSSKGIVPSASTLKHVELNLGNDEYLKFFGMEATEWGLEERLRTFEFVLDSSLVNVKHLSLKFRSTRWGPLTCP